MAESESAQGNSVHVKERVKDAFKISETSYFNYSPWKHCVLGPCYSKCGPYTYLKNWHHREVYWKCKLAGSLAEPLVSRFRNFALQFIGKHAKVGEALSHVFKLIFYMSPMRILPFLPATSDFSTSSSGLAWSLNKSSLREWCQNLEVNNVFPNVRLIPHGHSNVMIVLRCFAIHWVWFPYGKCLLVIALD